MSYPLYLVHWPIYIIIYEFFHTQLQPHVRSVVIYQFCAMLRAMAIYHLEDRPGRKFVLKKFGFKGPLATMHATPLPSVVQL
ncbi:MAG TPA: hypothetical protein VH619_13030 [Verrucomicrobiae bacterium]|jgi:peptidoglycan/LPS O-acetylase OafA/YrhL|nr:hypothetical protein [Verrucomicrobiae bacterium]